AALRQRPHRAIAGRRRGALRGGVRGCHGEDGEHGQDGRDGCPDHGGLVRIGWLWECGRIYGGAPAWQTASGFRPEPAAAPSFSGTGTSTGTWTGPFPFPYAFPFPLPFPAASNIGAKCQKVGAVRPNCSGARCV